MRIEDAIKQRKFQTEYQRAIINLLYTSNWLRDQRIGIFKPFGLTTAQYNVLRILNGSAPKPLSAGAIKEVMLDKSPDLTRLLDKLCERGFVNREICAQNRRKMDITITKAGKQLLKDIEPDVAQLSHSGKITTAEANELSRILDKLRS